MTAFPLSHIIESQQFDRDLLEVVFRTADQMKADLFGERRLAKSLEGRIMASLFYEPSTRTRFSFESAMLRLGGIGDHDRERPGILQRLQGGEPLRFHPNHKRLRRRDCHASQRSGQRRAGLRKSPASRSSMPEMVRGSTPPRPCWTCIPSWMPSREKTA